MGNWQCRNKKKQNKKKTNKLKDGHEEGTDRQGRGGYSEGKVRGTKYLLFKVINSVRTGRAPEGEGVCVSVGVCRVCTLVYLCGAG